MTWRGERPQEEISARHRRLSSSRRRRKLLHHRRVVRSALGDGSLVAVKRRRILLLRAIDLPESVESIPVAWIELDRLCVRRQSVIGTACARIAVAQYPQDIVLHIPPSDYSRK